MEMSIEFLPAVKGSGFEMEGYHVWCGSVIKEGDTYYLFAARWPEAKEFPQGYMTDSEIVIATTDNLSKPFEFKKVLFGKRGGNKWDSTMSHNPYIFKTGDTYVLYYIGSPDGSYENRAVGYAYSKNLTEGWVRSDEPVSLPPDANNPAVIQAEDGSYLMYFRDGNLQVSVARAQNFSGPFTVINKNLFPKSAIEDMFVYKTDEGYQMICEDCLGFYTGLYKGGVGFSSPDGINWIEESATTQYGFDIEYDDGSRLTLQRRERPFLFKDGERLYLFTTAKQGGPDQLTGGKTWNMVQEIKSLQRSF